MDGMWQAWVVGAAALIVFSQRLDRVIAIYLFSVVNLEAFRFAGEETRITFEAVCSALVALRLLATTPLSGKLRRAWRDSSWITIGVGCLAGAAIVSAFVSIDAMRSWKAVLRVLSYLPLLAGIQRTLEMRGARWMTGVCLASSIVPLLCAAMQMHDPELVIGDREWTPEIINVDESLSAEGLPRLNGTLNNSNALAEYLVIVVGWAAVSGWVWKRRPYYLYLIGLAALTALLLTFSRGVWLCTAAGGLLWAAVSLPRRTTALLVLVALLAGSGVAAYTGIIEARFRDIGAPSNSLVWRWLVWTGILERSLTRQQVLFGHGYDTMVVDNSVHEGYKAHNAYLAAYHDCGLAGVAAQVLLFGIPLWSLRRGLRRHWARPGVRAAMSFGLFLVLGFVVLSVTEEPLAVPVVAVYFWTILLTCEKTARELVAANERG